MKFRLESFVSLNLLSRNFQIVIVAGLAGLLAACGGSSNDSEEPMPEPVFKVTAITPEADATGLPVTTKVTAEFSQSLLATTVSPENIWLSLDGEPVAAEVQLTGEGNGIQLTSEQPLELLRRYSVNFAGELSDIAGNRLGSAYSWRFTTEDGHWSEARTLRQSAGSRIQQFHLVDASAGPGLAFWSELPEGNGFKVLWSVNRGAGETVVPTAPVRVSGDGGQVVRWTLASNQIGDTVAVWLQADGDVLNLYARVYRSESGQWGDINKLAEDLRLPDFEFSPAVSASGDTLLAWSSSNPSSGHQELFASHYSTQDEQWSEAQQVNPDVEHGFAPRLVFGGDGRATLLYLALETGGVDSHLLVQRYRPHDGWLAPEDLSHRLADHRTHTLVANDQGQVVVIWQEPEPTATRLQARQFIPDGDGGNWQPVASLVHNHGVYNGYSLSMDESGNTALMWSSGDAVDGETLRHQVSYFLATENRWLAEPATLGMSPEGMGAGQLAGNGRGDLVAVWSELMGPDSANVALVGRQFEPENRSWGPEKVISSGNAEKGNLTVAMDAAGHGQAAWSVIIPPQGQEPGTTQVLTSRFNRYTGVWEKPVALGERQRAGIGVQLQMTNQGRGWVLWGSVARYDSDLVINELMVPATAPQ